MADYPFTTLYPNLGVVAVEEHRSFVMADIPGLIAGAAEGAGLGIRFLKHLARTRLLLHVLDIAPVDSDTDLGEQVRTIVAELAAFDSELAARERWLVLNKSDLLTPADAEARQQEIVAELEWSGPVYLVSAATGAGTQLLAQRLMQRLEEIAEEEAA